MTPEEWKALLEQCTGSGSKSSIEAAHRRLYELCFKKVFNYLIKRTRDHDLAEFLSQNSYLKILKQLDQWIEDSQSEFVSYLITIGKNELNDHYKFLESDKRKTQKLTIEASTHQVPPLVHEETLIERENIQKVNQALRAVQEVNLKPMLLCEYENYSYDEIAKSLEIPVGTVRSRIARGRMQFTQEYMRLTRIEEGKERALKGEGR